MRMRGRRVDAERHTDTEDTQIHRRHAQGFSQ